MRRRFQMPVTVRGKIPGIASVPKNLVFAGERFLLELGKATWRPDRLDDPGRLFGLLKYAGAISAKSSHLKLKSEMTDLDTHKKKVLSDEFGCGMAFVFAQRVLKARRILDLETAVRRGWVTTRAGKRERPDFIGQLQGGGLLVLEAKGTQCGHAYSWSQVQKGCGQVRRVKLPTGSRRVLQARVAVGVSIGFDGSSTHTALHVQDPEEDNALDYSFDGDPDETLVRGHYLRVAALVGDLGVAAQLEGRDRQVGDLQDVPHRLIGRREYVGSEVVVQHGRSELGFFVGLAADVREDLLHGNWQRLASRQDEGNEEIFEFSDDQVDDARLRHVLSGSESPGRRRWELGQGDEDDHSDPDGETFAQSPDGTAWLTWSRQS
ncbi:MAG: hypothetical protein AMXMBFR56_53410 [Polyangiaceae bacterium]